MRIVIYVCLLLSLSSMLCAQPGSEEQSISRLLTGKKNPEDQETIAALGIGSLDILLKKLMAEQEANSLAIYARLIGVKYRQFENELPRDKQTNVLNALASRIAEVEDVPPSSYTIQSTLRQLQGIDHPVIKRLIDKYSHSNEEWTRAAARHLADSIAYPLSPNNGMSDSTMSAFGADQPAVIDLNNGTTLTTLFDAGLRPTNVSSAQHMEVEVRNQRVLFRASPNLQFTLEVEQARFSIGAKNVVMELQAKSSNLTLDDAYNQAVSLFGAAGQVPKELHGAVERARSSRSFAPLAKVGLAHRPAEGPELRVGFLPGDFNPSAPETLHVRLGFTAYWKERVHDARNVRRNAISPPPGHENHSMEAIVSDTDRFDSLPTPSKSMTAPSPDSTPSETGGDAK